MTDQAVTSDSGKAALPGLLLLFAKGSRPSEETVKAVLFDIPRASVSHDPLLVASRKGSLEIVVDGLTFDLDGLRPGEAGASSRIDYPVDCDPNDLIDCEAVGLFPGPHLVEGANTLPIVRTMLGLGAGLAEKLNCVHAVCWTPARSAVSPSVFVHAVNAWLRGGQFPAPGLFLLHHGADGSVRSDGLAFFIDREFVFDREFGGSHSAASRIAASVAHDLIGYGVPDASREIVLDDCGAFKLELDYATDVVRVRPCEALPELSDCLPVG